MTNRKMLPLVMYVDGKRHVVGEAAIEDGIVTGSLNDEIPDEVRDFVVASGLIGASLGFDLAIKTETHHLCSTFCPEHG